MVLTICFSTDVRFLIAIKLSVLTVFRSWRLPVEQTDILKAVTIEVYNLYGIALKKDSYKQGCLDNEPKHSQNCRDMTWVFHS